MALLAKFLDLIVHLKLQNIHIHIVGIIPSSQYVPLNAEGQRHWNSSPTTAHVPPF